MANVGTDTHQKNTQMANQHKKECSTSFFTEGCKWNHNDIPQGWLKFNKTDNTTFGQGCEKQLEHSYIASGSVKWYSYIGKQLVSFSCS